MKSEKGQIERRPEGSIKRSFGRRKQILNSISVSTSGLLTTKRPTPPHQRYHHPSNTPRILQILRYSPDFLPPYTLLTRLIRPL